MNESDLEILSDRSDGCKIVLLKKDMSLMSKDDYLRFLLSDDHGLRIFMIVQIKMMTLRLLCRDTLNGKLL